MSDLGLPSLPAPSPGPYRTEVDRAYQEFTLPEAHLGATWPQSGFGEADRTFRLVELSPRQTEQALKLAGSNQVKASTELVLASVWQVGEWKTRPKRAELEKWWAAVGPKGRRLVEAAFMALQSVEEGDVDSFLASGKSGFGS